MGLVLVVSSAMSKSVLHVPSLNKRGVIEKKIKTVQWGKATPCAITHLRSPPFPLVNSSHVGRINIYTIQLLRVKDEHTCLPDSDDTVSLVMGRSLWPGYHRSRGWYLVRIMRIHRQVVVDASSTPDPDYIGVPKEVIYRCTRVNTSRTAGLYAYKDYTNHRYTCLYNSPDRVDHLSLDVCRSTGSYRQPRGNVYR